MSRIHEHKQAYIIEFIGDGVALCGHTGGINRRYAAEGRPNIVFFLVDDFGKGALQCMGSDLHETPNIDRLVQRGMQFSNGYVAC